eukprot:TRINITY_DN5629_c0_g1_i1.p1 TRINITY_DN5629_c0_g1~~TRINITY_DN5629_c0_g1_i1.p1  ORF type:complete len:113 (-),score=33.88 TRINITY_DN5629_c0_g1_i1:10-348(-)
MCIRDRLKSDKSVNACLVCYDSEPNAVLLNCGHGGICFECAQEVCMKRNECHLCRNPIAQILKIDLQSSTENKVMVLQAVKLNLTDDSYISCLLYTSPSPRDRQKSRMPSSA